MKVSEMTGALLDYWVARAEGLNPAPVYLPGRVVFALDHGKGFEVPFYSTDWAQAGPIIERERFVINGHSMRRMGFYARHIVERTTRKGDVAFKSKYALGPTPLVAAMRAYVASKFADEVADVEGMV